MAQRSEDAARRVPAGYVLAQGRSRFDGSSIVAIAVGFGRASHNRKTGPLIQVYVLPEAAPPSAALALSRDVGICGTCKHRPAALGTCYVDVAKGADSVWRGYRDGRYGPMRDLPNRLEANVVIRLTAYGDCAALPLAVWQPIVELVRQKNGTVLGYTHHWRTTETGFREFCMASVDSTAEQKVAAAMGWRTFRIRSLQESLGEGETQCPADSYANTQALCGAEKHTVTCIDCKLCTGGAGGSNISLVPHGVMNRKARLERWLSR